MLHFNDNVTQTKYLLDQQYHADMLLYDRGAQYNPSRLSKKTKQNLQNAKT